MAPRTFRYSDSNNSYYTSENLARNYYFGNGYSVLNSANGDLPLYQREGYINWMAEFTKKNDYLLAYPEVEAKDFYRDIFEADTIEGKGETGKPCPIISVTNYRPDGTSYVKNVTVFNDYSALDKAYHNDFALCSMCTFSGRHKTAKSAYKCHGFCIDLDGVDLKHLQILLLGIEKDIIPRPTYIVNSGHGVHVYYVFEQPVPLYPKLISSLQRLKKGLTREVWTRETSMYDVKDRQFQGIYQNFRMVGSKSKLAYDKKNKRYKNTRKFFLRAFSIGNKVDITYLNRYVDEEYRMDANPNDWASYSCPDITPVNQAKELWPDWYERRVVQGLEKNHYICSDKLYKWWLNKIMSIAKDGNRYWCIAFLYVYGIKCGIDKEWIDMDAYSLVSGLNELTVTEDNEFTDEDVVAASKMYKPESIDCPLSFIEEKCGIHVERSRRNGRKQIDHLRRARALQYIDDPNGDWRKNNGRPKGSTKTETKSSLIVKEWIINHPEGRKADCIRDTGLDKKTVYKWWNR